MAQVRTPRYEEGNALSSCDICGLTALFPDGLILADDGRLWCKRQCWNGKTVLTDQRERAAFKGGYEQPAPPHIGRKPAWWE